MNKLMSDFNNAKNALYEHVGFREDWIYSIIEDRTEYYWVLAGRTVRCYRDIENMDCCLVSKIRR